MHRKSCRESANDRELGGFLSRVELWLNLRATTLAGASHVQSQGYFGSHFFFYF